MKANNILIDLGILHTISPTNVPDFIKNLFNHPSEISQEETRRKIHLSWEDVNAFIINTIQKQYKYSV
jgi:plasmid maintenance system antidote protein VapI